nr:hypothetical protein [Tanacetum cinerariifolium]
ANVSAVWWLRFCCLFWNTAVVKRSGDVIRLQALVDKKKIVIYEDAIREILQLDDAEGVVCLPNEEIFTGLAQMGYEKPSTKLTFYKAFFSKGSSILVQQVLDKCSALVLRVKGLESVNTAQQLEILKLKARVKKLERLNNPAVVAISAAKPAAKPKVLKIVPNAPTVSTRKRKGVVIRDPEEELHDDT